MTPTFLIIKGRNFFEYCNRYYTRSFSNLKFMRFLQPTSVLGALFLKAFGALWACWRAILEGSWAGFWDSITGFMDRCMRDWIGTAEGMDGWVTGWTWWMEGWMEDGFLLDGRCMGACIRGICCRLDWMEAWVDARMDACVDDIVDVLMIGWIDRCLVW